MYMLYKGSCRCNDWQVVVSYPGEMKDLNPRVCDCNSCKNKPFGVISDPTMDISLKGNRVSTTQNGDQIANFYFCSSCGDFLAVGCKINGLLRGAVNTNLLHAKKELGASIQIQPRLLSADEKINRWDKLWGLLNGV